MFCFIALPVGSFTHMTLTRVIHSLSYTGEDPLLPRILHMFFLVNSAYLFFQINSVIIFAKYLLLPISFPCKKNPTLGC